MSRNRILAVFLLAAAAATAEAVQIELSRPELCALSHHVVIGEVTDLETRWTTASGGGIERIVHVAVTDRIRGERTQSLEVTLPGGQIGDVGHWVEDVPRLMVNGRYLLFLATAMDGSLQVIGGEHGAVRITSPGARVGEPLERVRASVEVCREAR